MAHSLAPLFEPRGVMVVGASSTPGKLGAVMAQALSRYGEIALVNSRNPSDDMHPNIASAVLASKSGIDLAVLCVPANATPDALKECASNGVKAVLVCSGGFAEIGEAGELVARKVSEVISQTGIRLLGPNTSGFFAPGRGLLASFVPGVSEVTPGRVAVVAASGGMNHVLAFKLEAAGAGVSLAVGIGAGMDVSAPDVLDYLIDDEQTTAVALHLETVSDGPRLLDAISRLSSVKPVVALVVGRNDVSEFAASHTGALATSWRTTRSVLSQAGAVVVDNEDQLVAAVNALSRSRMVPTADARVGLITAQAGPGLLIADALKSAGLEIPTLAAETRTAIAKVLPPLTYQANPVDTGRPGPGFDQVVSAVASDSSIDVVAVYGITEPVADLPALIAASGVIGTTPLLLGVDGPPSELRSAKSSAEALDLPLSFGPTALAQGITALVTDARAQYDRQGITERANYAISPRSAWDEVDGKNLLDALELSTPQRRRCTNSEEAFRALAEIGGPVAVKIIDSTTLHKTDIGGVHLGVETPAALESALTALREIGAQEFLVEAMAPSGVDLILGVRRDPVFGAIVMLGLGGVAAEVIEDVAIASLPTTERVLQGLPDRLLSRDLLFGHRSGPTLDRGELTSAITKVGYALLSNPHLSEIEINPLRLTSQGLIALDAVIINAEP